MSLFDLYTGKPPSRRACVLLLYSIRRGDQSALMYNHLQYRGSFLLCGHYRIAR